MTHNKSTLASAAPQGERAESARELEALNRFTKTPLVEAQVYLFSVRLCDNEVDRDEECFSRAALEQLAPLFVGKSGLFDHNWSAREQAARIYRTEVASEPGMTEHSGEPKCFLKGYAYMLRCAEHESLIEEIEAGIKKEVSVSCAVAGVICSICGHALEDRVHCSHVKGRDYDGKRCYGLLHDPLDAYEWSFVAVPAQRNAGVIKALQQLGLQEGGRAPIREEDLEAELGRLQAEAQLGRKYLRQLREEVLRLGLLSQKGFRAEQMEGICEKLSEEELLSMKQAYEAAALSRLPLETQLPFHPKRRQEEGGADLAFRI